jgi:hypothetical protein
MSLARDAVAEYRLHPFAIIGSFAAIAAAVLLLIGLDRGVRQAYDPDAAATSYCGGAMGRAAPTASDTSDCYGAAAARSPFDAAGGWLLGGASASVVVAGCAVAATRRRRVATA